MIWLILGGFILIALIDLVPLIKKRKGRAIAAFACLFAAALVYALLTVFDVKIPSIMTAWKDFIDWLGLSYQP